ncbi:hypothetical protein FZEAL_1157 [Fusarium zealandicum]|uniref:DUF4238 domain-containing protein n=1 Tax=Fusarium zealandicum TaxID=1053134 RepID=A0A8H4UTI7_9HYPO|nr:hypothetical protein FZEAL_1157 [Fusarium zealandicum]
MSSTNQEYQHFIPQFLLKNYSRPFSCPNAKGRAKKCKGHKHEKLKYPGDPIVNLLRLTSEPFKLDVAPVARVFGQWDMYEDIKNTTNTEHRRIEGMFGRMEVQASRIFRKITNAFNDGKPNLWLTRDERNLLRKFLFLLKYRGSAFHQRFYHLDSESYSEVDKELLHDFMEKRGFERPLDVWFHNLEVIMSLEMDPNKEWTEKIKQEVFHGDAMWFIMHVEYSYMAICTPETSEEEFILTDNAYNIFEGPNSFVEDSKTGKRAGDAWVNLHEFAPISPKLMLVLRSCLIPSPEEEDFPQIKEENTEMRRLVFGEVLADNIPSILRDLPVEKASNNYTEMVNGKLALKPGRNNSFHKDDRFRFSFFPVETRHVRLINGILLDNSYINTTIAFGTERVFLNTLDWFLTEPCESGKIITGPDANLRLAHVRNLATFMRSTGWEKEAVWVERPTPIVDDVEKIRLNHLKFRQAVEGLENDNRKGLGACWKGFVSYERLGGSALTMFRDFDQAQRMLDLRIKIDAWSCGVEELVRVRNRFLLIEEYMNLPCLTGQGASSVSAEVAFNLEGPEDQFVQNYGMMHPVEVNNFMYYASITA